MAGNYDMLYDQSRERFLTFDQEEMIRCFGLRHDAENIRFHVLGRDAALDRRTGVITVAGERAGFNEACTAYDILSRAERRPALSGRWVSIAELGGSVATSHVEKLTNELLDMNGRTEEFKTRCRGWGGVERKQGDVSFIVPLFDFFPVWLQFWEGDDEFPPQFRCLWDANTLDFMFYETTWYAHGFLLSRLRGRGDRR